MRRLGASCVVVVSVLEALIAPPAQAETAAERAQRALPCKFGVPAAIETCDDATKKAPLPQPLPTLRTPENSRSLRGSDSARPLQGGKALRSPGRSLREPD
jgi:hypothetical protein